VVCLSVGLSVTTVSPAKTAEATVMLFRMLARVERRYNALHGIADTQCEGQL